MKWSIDSFDVLTSLMFEFIFVTRDISKLAQMHYINDPFELLGDE